MHPQSYGFEAFFPGDEVEFTEIHSLQCLHKASFETAIALIGVR